MNDTSPPSAAGGRIMLVGLGPGSHEHLTARARAASVYKTQKFSDHAPLTIDYGYAL